MLDPTRKIENINAVRAAIIQAGAGASKRFREVCLVTEAEIEPGIDRNRPIPQRITKFVDWDTPIGRQVGTYDQEIDQPQRSPLSYVQTDGATTSERSGHAA